MNIIYKVLRFFRMAALTLLVVPAIVATFTFTFLVSTIRQSTPEQLTQITPLQLHELINNSQDSAFATGIFLLLVFSVASALAERIKKKQQPLDAE
ncbi:hypothetical protein [Photobacterium piscicola]|uniref:hypothetical protein n=1 Tax=Photobacterium piscicola TaxID=1378299 RepID=UPI0037360306